MDRVDCLFCIPHRQTQPSKGVRTVVPSDNTDTITIEVPVPSQSQISAYTVVDSITDWLVKLLQCIEILVKLGIGFMAVAYVGKFYLCIYFAINPDRDDSWFGWDKFGHLFGEFMLGGTVSMVLMGCCVSD